MDETVKNYTETYIYSKFGETYRKRMIDAILHAERIDKNSQEFMEDVVLEIKRSKAPAYLQKVLTSSNTVLMYPKESMPRMFKVFCAKDPKDKKLRVFIDVSNVIKFNASTGRFNTSTETLIANLVEAKINMAYYMIPKTYTKKTTFMVMAIRSFAKLFTHLVDYTLNISVIPGNRNKMMYFAAKYFITQVLQYSDDEDRVNALAQKAVDVKGTEASIFDMVCNFDEDFTSFPAFVDFIGKAFKVDKEKNTMSLFTEKWMFLYGPGTILAVEYLPTFISMITNAYCGVYLNNQKTIEKILGNDLVAFGKEVIYDNAGIK